MLKKRLKNLIASLVSSSLILTPVLPAVGTELGEAVIRQEATYNAPIYTVAFSDFDYSVSNDEVILSKYKGNNKGSLKIPATMNISGNDCKVVLEGEYIFGAPTAAENRYGINNANFDNGVIFRGDVSSLFANSPVLTAVTFNAVDTGELTDMSDMFSGCGVLNAVTFAKQIDTLSVNDMSGMFKECRSLTSAKLGNLTTEGVMNMKDMFSGCSKLGSLDIGNFDTRKVTDMSGMFRNCRSLKSLDVSGFDTAAVKDMSGMFAGCALVSRFDISGFITGEVTDMSDMFNGCTALESVSVNGFDTSKVTDMSRMFNGCQSAASISLNGINTSKVTGMSGMFEGCSSVTKLDVSGFDTASVTDMSSMFEGCSSLRSLDVSSFDTSSVNDMTSMFSGCVGLSVIDVSRFSTANLYDMNRMFKDCERLFVLDLSGFTFYMMTGFDSVFEGDINLLRIHTPVEAMPPALVAKLPAKMYEYRNGQIIKTTAYTDLMKAPQDVDIVTEDYDGNDSPSEDKIHKRSSSSTSSSSRKSSSSSTVSKNSSSSDRKSSSTSGKKGSSSVRKSSSSIRKVSSSVKTSSSRSSSKKSSSSTVSGDDIKDESSSSVSKNSASSSSAGDHGSASSSSSKGRSSSSEAMTESSSETKPQSSSSEVDLTEAALAAVSKGFADIADTTKLSPAGKAYTIEQEKEEEFITLAKGNKFLISGGKRGSFTTANMQYVSVSSKGLVKAKKHVAEKTGIRISYREEATGELKVIRVRVVEPVFTNVGARKLTIQLPVGREFDIGTLIPLNASFGTPANSGIVSDLEIKVEKDGCFHIVGNTVRSGNMTLPFTVYGKKFKARIRVK